MRVRVGDVWISVGVQSVAVPDASYLMIVDKDTMTLLDRVSADTSTLSGLKGQVGTLRHGLANAIKTRFRKSYMKPIKIKGPVQEVESLLPEEYRETWKDDDGVIWEDGNSN